MQPWYTKQENMWKDREDTEEEKWDKIHQKNKLRETEKEKEAKSTQNTDSEGEPNEKLRGEMTIEMETQWIEELNKMKHQQRSMSCWRQHSSS